VQYCYGISLCPPVCPFVRLVNASIQSKPQCVSSDASPENGKLHIRPRSVGQSFTLGSEVVRCVSGESHRACRTENNVNRQKVNFNRRKVFGPVSDATLKSGSEVNEGH